MADAKRLLGKLLVSLQLRFLIMEPLNERTLLGLEDCGLSWCVCGVGDKSPQLGVCVCVSLQVVKVPFTVQLQNHSQQLLLGANCHLWLCTDTAGWGQLCLRPVRVQLRAPSSGELTGSQGVGDPQGLGFRRLQF